MEERKTRRYAEASRRDGELRLSEAATELELHPDTVRRYALARIRGEPSPLSDARQDRLRRVWIPRTAIDGFRLADPDDADADASGNW